uniref:Cordon-bleu ubiquitin-like domain-containing protein n=1 Tax=Erpetoichthys calabaricus TaxID=27687 RepID=A0A8C4T6B9_ERPCA
MNSVGVSSSAKPPTGKMKARAPPPPPPAAPRPAPRRNFPPTLPLSQEDGDRSSGDQKENVLRDSLDVLLTLPGGIQKRTTVSGSKALMDLLVDLCSQYHLSPVHHTLELQTRDAQPLAFKPNTLLGMLDVHTVLIKERVAEEKPKRPPPKLPEKTVRLVVNYHKTQKAVVRVSPVVPLSNLIPIICDKCEFDPRHIVLLRDSSSSKGLDLSKSLSDLGIRELYILDHSLALRSKIHSAPILNFSDPSRTSSVSTSVSDKKGLLGFFKLRRKSKGNYTAPNTPGINSRECTIVACHSMGNISRLSPKSELKKRRAPPPPPPGSASMQNFQSVSLDDIQVGVSSPR